MSGSQTKNKPSKDLGTTTTLKNDGIERLQVASVLLHIHKRPTPFSGAAVFSAEVHFISSSYFILEYSLLLSMFCPSAKADRFTTH